MRTARRDHPCSPWSVETRLLELGQAVQDASRSDAEGLSVVSRLVNRSRVVLRVALAGTGQSRKKSRRVAVDTENRSDP